MKNLTTAALAMLISLAAFSNNPDSAKHYFEKGMVEMDAKRYLPASQNFEKAISFNPLYTEAYRQNADAYLAMRKIDKAKLQLIKAHELDPSNQSTIKRLTNLYFDLRQWDQAAAMAAKCNECNSDKITGVSMYEKEDYAKAEKFLKTAAEKDPNDGQVAYNLARTYLELEAYGPATTWFEKSVALDPKNSRWAYEMALVYYNNSNWRQAATAFEKALVAGYPESIDFNENYGFSLIYGNQAEKGEARLMEVFKKKPNKELFREIASALYGVQKYDRALDYLQKLLEMDAKDARALYQAGMCFQKLGNKEKGQGMCDKAIEMDPSLASLRQKKGDSGFGL